MAFTPPELSIVIPAFNEERRLNKSLGQIHNYSAARGIRSEIIVVDDGSTDGTAELVRQFAVRYPELRLVSNGENRGKGFSVRHGMREALGEITLFTDADLSAPIEEADKLLEALRGGHFDVAIGSRAMNRTLISVHQSRLREMAGTIFNFMVRWLVNIPFVDTQCGFKAFRRQRAIILFDQQRTEGFGFDVETLFLAKRYGLAVAEIPVRWAHDPSSKVHVFADSIRMFLELVTIRWNSWVGRYAKADVLAAADPRQ